MAHATESFCATGPDESGGVVLARPVLHRTTSTSGAPFLDECPDGHGSAIALGRPRECRPARRLATGLRSIVEMIAPTPGSGAGEAFANGAERKQRSGRHPSHPNADAEAPAAESLSGWSACAFGKGLRR